MTEKKWEKERKLERERKQGRKRERKKYRWSIDKFQKARCREMPTHCGTWCQLLRSRTGPRVPRTACFGARCPSPAYQGVEARQWVARQRRRGVPQYQGPQFWKAGPLGPLHFPPWWTSSPKTASPDTAVRCSATYRVLLGASWCPCRRLADRKFCNASLYITWATMASTTRNWPNLWSRVLVAQMVKKCAVWSKHSFLWDQGSRVGDYEYFCLLGCDAMKFGRYLWTFQMRHFQARRRRQQDFWKPGKYIPDWTVSYSWKQ